MFRLIESLESRQFLAAETFPNEFARAEAAPIARFEGYNAVVGNKLYAMGGFNSSFEVIPNIDIYDADTGEWSTIKTNLPIAETHAGHAVDGSSIYFAGGYIGDLGENREQPITRAVWRYDTATNNWERLADLPAARGGGALVRLGRNLHYFGGCLSDRVTNTGAHWMLRLGNSSGGGDDGTEWIRRPAMPSPRDHFSAVAVDDRMYVFGGEYGHDVYHAQSKLAHAFEANTGEWIRLADMPTPKSHFESAIFEFDGKIIAAGGQVDDWQPTREVAQYEIESDSWSVVKSLPAPRQGGAVQKIGRWLVVTLGGVQTYQPQDDTWLGEFRKG